MKRINTDLLEDSDDGYGDVLLAGKPFTGIAEEFGDGGRRISEVCYEKGRLHGPSRSWHPNGNLKEEEFYRAGAQHGAWREWDEDGELIRDEVYERQMPVYRRDPSTEPDPLGGTCLLVADADARGRWQKLRSGGGPWDVTDVVDDEFVDLPWPFDDRLPEDLRPE